MTRGRAHLLAAGTGLALSAVLACSKPQKFTANVLVVQTEIFGSDPNAPTVMDVEMTFPDCPGTQRKLVRGDTKFALCAKKYKAGDTVPVEIQVTYKSERGEYRNEVVKVGDCPRIVDPKDEASFENVQDCKDLVVNGSVSGVHCERGRSPELVAKCPWFKRK